MKKESFSEKELSKKKVDTLKKLILPAALTVLSLIVLIVYLMVYFPVFNSYK